MEQRLTSITEPGCMEMLNVAAEAGNIDALYAIIRLDAGLLKRIDEVSFVDTPLHIAASIGHTDFAMEMVTLMPSYARKLNPDGFSPLHLALQNEKTDLVLCLIEHDKDTIRVKGRNGMTPLHFAAAQQNLLLLAKFLAACPQCIKDVTIQGKTALHIALQSEKMEAFQVLMGWLRRYTHKDATDLEDLILNWRDYRGNSVLHIAAYKGQVWAVKLLLKSQLVDVKTENKENLTALDIAKQSDNREIMKMLRWRTLSLLPKVKPLTNRLTSKISNIDKHRIRTERDIQSIPSDTRDALLVVFALVAAATYEAALNPPGGLWQGQLENNSSIPKAFNVGVDTHDTESSPYWQPPPPPPRLGTIIMDSKSFNELWFLNTYALWFSLIVILFLFPSGSRKLLIVPLLLMFACYAVSMSVISPQLKKKSYLSSYCIILFLTVIMYLHYMGPIMEMRARRVQREWGSSHII